MCDVLLLKGEAINLDKAAEKLVDARAASDIEYLGSRGLDQGAVSSCPLGTTRRFPSCRVERLLQGWA